MVGLEEIQEAAERLAPILRKTPIEHVHAVSSASGRDIWVKEEQLQRSGSYKIRGAYNFVSRMPAGETAVAASDGNHSQGVALAAKMTDRPCELYVPRRTSLSKIDVAEAYGARVNTVDGDIDDAVAAAKERTSRPGSFFVPSYDDPFVIAGAGTVGLELAAELPESIETVVVPVGAGGLISGVAVALKALRPEIRVVGVEAAGAATMRRSLREGHPVRLERAVSMADCIAVREVSQLTLDHVREFVDDMVIVTEAEISHALLVLIERAKVVVEPGAAASLAAVMAGEVPGNGSVCCLLSGGNVEPVMLMKLIEQGLTSAGRFVIVRIVMPDTPGALADLTKKIADLGINILDIENNRSGHLIEADQVQIDFTLQARNRAQHQRIAQALSDSEFDVEVIN